MRRRVLVGTAAAVAGGATYWKVGRPRVLNWGATLEEGTRTMPGDDLLPGANLQTTRAVTVQASPERIWPWLAQMGPRPRAGAYTYDWIERLLGIDIENSDRILPEFQHLEPGEVLALNKDGTNGLRLQTVEPGRCLVVQWTPADSTWCFELCPAADGTTRLISRNRLKVEGWGQRLFMVALMEPGSLVMERKMLLGIKERAERTPDADIRSGMGAELPSAPAG